MAAEDRHRALGVNYQSKRTQVQAFFRASTYTTLGDDASTRFWEDRWLQGAAPSNIAPNLVLLVSRRTRARLTVRQGLQSRHWMTRAIFGAMSTEAAAEYLDLWEATELILLNDQPDRTVWRWTPDGNYSTKSAYNMLHVGSITFRGHSLIWKTWALLRMKIFLWLTLRRRHWTNDHRARHGLETREECYLCDQTQETIDHLLCCCPYASRGLVSHLPCAGTPIAARRADGPQVVEATESGLTG
jgi:hypothetical protein